MRLTLFCAHSSLIDYLLAENERVRGERDHERRRAEVAINERLRMAQAPPLPVSEIRREPTPEEKEIAALLKNPEFTEAGAVE